MTALPRERRTTTKQAAKQTTAEVRPPRSAHDLAKAIFVPATQRRAKGPLPHRNHER